MPIAVSSSLAAAAPGSFTIDVDETSVLPGESARISVQKGSETGFTGISTEADMNRKVFWVMHLDDDSANMHVSGGGKLANESARIVYDRAGNKAWTTPGAKTVTISAYGPGLVLLAEETVNITVLDPDVDVVWDVSIYHSPDSNWTGMPADNGTTIRRTSSWADFVGMQSLFSVGDDVRVVCADGEDMDMTTSGGIFISNGPNATFYMHSESYGATGLPQYLQTTVNRTSALFNEIGGNANYGGKQIFCGLHFHGGYDPTDPAYQPGSFFSCTTADSVNTPISDIHLSHCVVKGFYNGVSSGGIDGAVGSNISYRSFYDIDMGDMFNYCHFHGQGLSVNMVNGGRMMGHPQTAMGDGKGERSPDFPDHAIAWRWHNGLMNVAYNVDVASSAGWQLSTSAPYTDDPLQHCFRIHPMDATSCQVYISDVRGAGNFLFSLIDMSGNAIDVEPTTVVQRCLWAGKRFADSFISTMVGNMYVRNNIIWLPSIYSTSLSADAGFNFMLRNPGVNAGTIDVSQSYIEFNTILSDRDATLQGDGAFNETFDGGTWIGAAYNYANNWYEIPGHSNVGSYPSQGTPSRGDLFVPVTGSAVIAAVTGVAYRPVDDYARRTRPITGDTNAGAHDTEVGSSASVTAPANTVAPTLNTFTSYSDEHYMENGTWTGINDNTHLGIIGEHLWLREYDDGVDNDIRDTRYTESLHQTTGTLTGRVGYAGLGGGQPVWANVSNSIDLAA